MGSRSLLQGISPTQGLNPGLLHYRRILYPLGSPGVPQRSQIRGNCKRFFEKGCDGNQIDFQKITLDTNVGEVFLAAQWLGIRPPVQGTEFSPWSRKIPLTTGQLAPGAAAEPWSRDADAVCLEPVLQRGATAEKPALTAAREGLRAATRPSAAKIRNK